MASAVIKFSTILVLVAVCGGHVAHRDLTNVCLDCICQAVSGCRQPQPSVPCTGDVCGLFHITWPYWADAGKNTLNGQSPDAPDAYQTCTKDPNCAARTVQGYMKKFAQDCNGDGLINCYDYMAIHMKGGYGCKGELPSGYVSVFNQCITAAGAAGNLR